MQRGPPDWNGGGIGPENDPFPAYKTIKSEYDDEPVKSKKVDNNIEPSQKIDDIPFATPVTEGVAVAGIPTVTAIQEVPPLSFNARRGVHNSIANMGRVEGDLSI